MKKLIILIIIGAALYYGYKWRVNNEFSDANLAKQIPIVSKQMGLPQVNGPVTLDSMSAEPGQRIIIKATLTVAPARDLNVDKLLASKDVLTKPLCKDVWVLLALKHGVTATYQIYGNDNILATEVTVTKADCGS